ncbi:MAG TPA: winged helix-turn-helix domain-containing protein [Pyrinomonadaceae bacterium]|nr:winged helix-turn-helix domain-containing protein [Pyrinomonadaceae bacterium]
MSTEPAARAGTQATAIVLNESVYDDGRLRVEHDNYYVSLDGRLLKLPRKEFLILSRLAQSAERIVVSVEIWRYAWGARADFNAESLHVHIYRLRRRLESHGLHIETMVNVGYRLLAAARPTLADSQGR